MTDKITKQEKGVITRRKVIFQGILGAAFCAIGLRLWNLQVVQGAHYKRLSEENRIRLLFVEGLRGLVYDKNNKVVAKNVPSYNLFVSSRRLKDVEKTLKKISFTLSIPYNFLLANFRANLRISNLENIKVFSGLNWNQVSLVEAYQEEFPRIFIDVSPIRQYLFSEFLAHSVGYTNLANEEDVKRIFLHQTKSASSVGKFGIEQQYNEQLLGSDGKIRLEINSENKIINTQYIEQPKKGSDIHLNIDSHQQVNLYKAFGDRKGAAIIMDPYNGKVLAMCSSPSFDPNQFSYFFSEKEWENFYKNKRGILSNRCIQSIYSPGSTFKMLLAIAALEEGIIDKDFEYNCVGHYRVNRKNYYCWKRSGHKKVNVVQALAQSCNTFFYQLGLELGIEKIYEYAIRMGFNTPTGVDMPNEKKGIIPNKAWKRKTRNEKWYLGETVGVSIGQNFVGVTPLQLLSYVNAIINGGTLVQPRVADYVRQGKRIKAITSEKKETGLKVENLEIILEGMRASVSSKDGTNKVIKNNDFSAGGKTGTTQVISEQTKNKILKEQGKLEPHLENHAWFTGFFPAYNPKYSVVVFIENGKKGTNAARLAKEVFYNLFYQNKASVS
jgi:penicillin-binding protein 2